MKDVFLELEVLTPVHIGTDETLDPMSYIIREEDHAPVFYTVNTMAWIEDQANPKELTTLFAGNNVAVIRKHLASRVEPDVYAGRRAEMAAQSFLEEDWKKLADQQTLHSLQISPGLTSAAQQNLIIPGSSIKGAIRTAIIDLLDREENLNLKDLRSKDKKGFEVQKKLEEYFGDIRSSAFKQLKIGDFDAFLDSSIIVDAQEKSRKADKLATPKDPCEVLPSRIMRPAGRWRLHGRGKIGNHANKDDSVLQLNISKYRWNWHELAKVVNDFYQARYCQEKTKFYKLLAFNNTARALAEVEDAIINPKPGEMVLRVGHYSHVECVTITNNNPETRLVKDMVLPFGTTRTLASGIYPFGWIKLRPSDEGAFQKGLRECQSHNDLVLAARLQKRKNIIAAKEASLLERQRQTQEEEAQRVRAEQFLAQWATLSEEEQDLAIVRQEDQALRSCPNADPMRDIWPKLDSASPEHRMALAKAFKETWANVPKMWQKKACSAKQWNKVQRVKKILGID